MPRFLRLNCIFMTLGLLMGCTVGPDFIPPAPPVASRYTNAPLPSQTVSIKGEEEKTQKFIQEQHIIPQWWALFQCQPLNQLINQGLKNSPTLEAAQAALRQAVENLNAERGGFFPAVDAGLGASRQRSSLASSGLPGPSYQYNLYTASLNASYNLDIFGTLRRQVEALDAEVDYQRFELEAAYLSLTSTIVTTVIEEASLRSQIQITKDLLESQEKQLSILKLQFKLGGISLADILSQETLVAQTRASLPVLNKQLSQARHSLAVLVGELPSEASLPYFTFDTLHLPADLPLTLPSSLVQQRPDVKAAEALLHQASAEIGVATAQMFPQLSLTASIGDVSNKANRLFASSSTVWSLGSQLLQPLFRGGALIAQKNAAVAAYDQAFAKYRQTVLEAFQQVADVLDNLVEDAKAHKAQQEAEKFAYQAVEISRQQYRLGGVSFLAVLIAERQYQETRINYIQAKAARYADTVALFKALGGDCYANRLQQAREEIMESFLDCCGNRQTNEEMRKEWKP